MHVFVTGGTGYSASYLVLEPSTAVHPRVSR